jgi:hypothetical protein
MASPRLNKAIGRLGSLLAKNPQGASQISTPSLESVSNTQTDMTGASNIVAKKELQKRATSGDYETPSTQMPSYESPIQKGVPSANVTSRYAPTQISASNNPDGTGTRAENSDHKVRTMRKPKADGI